MKTIYILLFVVLISGCCTQRRCLTKFPPQTVIERSDSIIIRDTVIYHDLVIRDSIRADTVYKERIVKVPVDLVVLPVEAENDYARAKAWVENRKLKLELTQKEQVIIKIKTDAIKEVTHWQALYQLEKRKEATIIYKPRKIHKIAMWFSGIVILLSVVYIYLKVK